MLKRWSRAGAGEADLRFGLAGAREGLRLPTGPAWAEDLDYPHELSSVPDTAVESFAGVANPFSLGRLAPGKNVLDIGCGAGTDRLVAAQMVAPAGPSPGST